MSLENLSSRVRSRLQALIGPDLNGMRLCVGFSGGLDSTVLLHLLSMLAPQLGFRLFAAHIHHGLSPHADAWAGSCEEVCRAVDVPLNIVRVEIDRRSSYGLEAAARVARHTALAALACDWIVLAHHRGDQAETLMYRLVRGTGVNGAAAMREIDSARRLLRPLLDEPHAALQTYAREYALTWIEDESNRDTRFARNALRHQILEPLNSRFPSAEANLTRATRHFSEAAELLAELAAEDECRVGLSQPGSRINLRALSAPRARNLLRYLLARHGEHAPDEARLLDALKQLCAAASATRVLMGETALCAYRDRFWLEPAGLLPQPCVWLGESVLPWGQGEVRFTSAEGPTALRLNPNTGFRLVVRNGHERLRLHTGGPSRAFKQLCQEAGIPPWSRPRLPVLSLGDQAMWIGGLGADVSMRCAIGEHGWLLKWDEVCRHAQR